ncbi:hypothetical protein EBB07_28870 [Paenibacillaceae bacterium]|nr:hypothetical protein EBB07_28870 [Paenibacillaceae bacterium]
MKNITMEVINSIDKYKDDIAGLTLNLNKMFESLLQVIGESNEVEWIWINDINFIDRDGRETVIYHKNAKRYKHSMNHEMCLKFLEKYNFIISDNKIIVNIDNVKSYCSGMGKCYFENGMYTTISKPNKKKFKDLGCVDENVKESLRDKRWVFR